MRIIKTKPKIEFFGIFKPYNFAAVVYIEGQLRYISEINLNYLPIIYFLLLDIISLVFLAKKMGGCKLNMRANLTIQEKNADCQAVTFEKFASMPKHQNPKIKSTFFDISMDAVDICHILFRAEIM